MKTSGRFRTWAEINLQAVVSNLKRLRSLSPDLKVIGVIKADAYGHGMYRVAKTLAREGIRCFGVANVLEAEIASGAVPKSDVLILSPSLPAEIPRVLQNKRWISTVSNEQERGLLEKEAKKQKTIHRVHVNLDTGMGRLGGFSNEIFSLSEKIWKSSHLKLAGIYTHFSSADVDQGETLKQVAKLKSFYEDLVKRGIMIPEIHFQNSAGVLSLGSGRGATSIRPGLALYGVPNPLKSWKKRYGTRPLSPVLSWKASVVLVRSMPKGTTISYRKTFRAKKNMKVAVLAVGYGDGVYRKLSNRGEVLIQGRRCRILGRVTMDMTMVDVTHVPGVKWGDPAVLIGKSGKDEITVHEFADWAETNAYEILCNIGKRVVRIPV